MKRTIISLIVILTVIASIVVCDAAYLEYYVGEVTNRLEELSLEPSMDKKKLCVDDLNRFYKENEVVIRMLVSSESVDEFEAILYKLASYIDTNDTHEVDATVAELHSRINRFYSPRNPLGTKKYDVA